MADPKNTGPGGFDVDGRTYTYDVGVPEAAGGDQGPRQETVNVNEGFYDSNGNPKDLTKKTKATLSQYLSDVTSGKKGGARVPNKYPVAGGSSSERNLSQKDGAPTGPTSVADANPNNFGGKVDPYTQQYPGLQPNLKKGKGGSANRTAADGNDFLKNKPAGTGPDVSPLGNYQTSVLSNNRFATAAKFGDGASTDAGFNPTLSKQGGNLGKYDPGAPTVTAGRMAAIGPLLTMRAGKELGAADGGANPNSGGSKAKSLLPGLGQIGISRIDQQVLLASDILSDLTNDNVAENPFVISPGGLSWGQLNNVNDPYSGTDALGMLALSTVLVAGVELLFDGLSILLGLVTPSLKTASRDAQGRYTLGEYLPGTKKAKKAASGGIGGALSALTSLNFGALLGIQPTNYPFSRALTTGMNAFFQVPDSKGGGIGLNQLAGAAASSIDSPGFNVVVARAIIRSSLTIVDQLKKIGGNPMNAITQILALIDTIRSSKLISACNVFASLGDSILSNPSAFVDPDSQTIKVSTIDSAPDVDGNAISKNRLKGTLKLAWASNRAPSTVLIPASIFAASLSVKNLGQFGHSMGIRMDPHSLVESRVPAKDDNGRISSELAYKFEEKLESSYVPFYFHDVRTNEMISFHAFLASLSDDYTANYEKSEGFGRVEAVKIYKSTERKIGMSFYIVSTSPNDFDDMYIKINKLVTMVYPQYTQGVQMQDSVDSPKHVFTQPFSQLIGASPMIRIRLGDLLRSNYTLFALGRLFGMGNPNFTVDGKTFTDGDVVDDETLKEYQKKIQELLKDPAGKKFYAAAGTSRYRYIADDGGGAGGLSLPVPKIPGVGGGDKGPKFAPEFDPGACPYKSAFVIKVKKINPENPFEVIGEVEINEDPLYTANTPGIKKYVEAQFKNDDMPLRKYIGGTYVFPITALTLTAEEQSKAAGKISSLSKLNPESEYGKKLAAFLSPDSNAIAKSFKDSGGKGLAGFIESMSFDWYDKVTWEIDHGRIAPKMCKVTLTFSPIHDITPGLDHHGFNRAPIYPVGAMAQGPMSYKK